MVLLSRNDNGNYEGHILAASDLLTKMNFREIHTIALIMEHLGMTWKKNVLADSNDVNFRVNK